MVKVLAVATTRKVTPGEVVDALLAAHGLTRDDVRGNLLMLLAVCRDGADVIDADGEEMPPSLPPGSILNEVA